MRPLTDTAIRASFVNATPDEAHRIPLPGLHEVMWGDREYLGWRDPSTSHRGYLVVWHGERPVGIVLRATESRARAGSAMCSLCQLSQPAGQVRMFTAALAGDAGRDGNSVGTYICADLACSMLIRIAPPIGAGPTRDELIERRSTGLSARVRAFAERVLARTSS